MDDIRNSWLVFPFMIAVTAFGLWLNFAIVRWTEGLGGYLWKECVAMWKQTAVLRERRVAVGVLLVGAFSCFWHGAASDPDPLTSGQWRLIGWVLIATAGAVRWRRV